MILREERLDGLNIVEVQGRIDSATALQFGEQLLGLLAMADERLLLDLSRVDYISSAGFRALLLAAKRADATKGAIALCGIDGKLAQLFDLAGFLDYFRVFASRDEARAGRWSQWQKE